jgi:hypothetical protein
VEFSKGRTTGDEVLSLQKNIRKLADEFLMNSSIKVFGKTIQPKDYAYQAKMRKEESVMEDTVKPINHHLVGKTLKLIKDCGGSMSEVDLLGTLGLSDVSELRPVVNRLAQLGKITIENDGVGPIYSVKVEETMMESFSKMFGTLRTSQQTLENVKILVRHKTPIDENVRGARSRHINAIFLECNGERFRFPHNYLAGARAMAQHLAHGGAMNDKVGSYISESTGQLLKLQSFNRYVTNNKLINEDSSSIVETIKESIETLRTELRKLTGVKTYESVKARLETFERETLEEDDVSNLKELFTIRRFDEKFEEVLPIVKQLVQEKDTYFKRIEEAAGNIIFLKPETINTTPIFEFSSENAKLGFKINELALRITENDELAGFINKIGTKLCKESAVNDFEKAILRQVLENAKVKDHEEEKEKELKESIELSTYFNRFDFTFLNRN